MSTEICFVSDSYVDSQELLDYLIHNQTNHHHLRLVIFLSALQSVLTVHCRQLCLDALVEEGDENFDWRLSFGEFKRLLSKSFQPTVKGEFRAGVGRETSLETSETKNRNLPVLSFSSPVTLKPFLDM